MSLEAWIQRLWPYATLIGSVVVALAIHWIVFAIIKIQVRRRRGVVDSALLRYQRRPTRLLVAVLAVLFELPDLPLPERVRQLSVHAVSLGLIAAIAWATTAFVAVMADALLARHPVDERDNLQAREARTRIVMLRRVLAVAIAIVTAAAMLMTFPAVRHVGASLLASAGIAGIIVGMAARPTLANLIAGVQLALTQPIRLDDVVIVEGEWGWIEEITTTYVVVRIWDLRRLVLPLSYFIEKPFQNWTRKTAALLGTVYVYVDYTVPVEELRQALHQILEASGMWDGETWGLSVTDAKANVVELRALMSAPDSGTAWNLRCHVREKLIAYLQEHYPRCLPRARVEVQGALPAAD